MGNSKNKKKSNPSSCALHRHDTCYIWRNLPVSLWRTVLHLHRCYNVALIQKHVHFTWVISWADSSVPLVSPMEVCSSQPRHKAFMHHVLILPLMQQTRGETFHAAQKRTMSTLIGQRTLHGTLICIKLSKTQPFDVLPDAVPYPDPLQRPWTCLLAFHRTWKSRVMDASYMSYNVCSQMLNTARIFGET